MVALLLELYFCQQPALADREAAALCLQRASLRATAVWGSYESAYSMRIDWPDASYNSYKEAVQKTGTLCK